MFWWGVAGSWESQYVLYRLLASHPLLLSSLGLGKEDVPEIQETLISALGGEFLFLGGTGGAAAALALLRAATEQHWAVRGLAAGGLGARRWAGEIGRAHV